jgi:hypothetical protein
MDELEDAAQSPNILVEDDPVLAKKLKNNLTGLHSVMGCRDAIQLHHSRAILLLDELENRESATKCEIEAVEEELAQARALQSK